MTKGKLKTGTWILVADGEKALVMENVGDEIDPNFKVIRVEEQDNPPTREQGANRPGRFNDGPSPHRSAVDDTDWHQLGKERFAADLAEMLYKRAHAGRFDAIVIVASPGVLGDLRGQLHKEVSDKVIQEVPKTLTNHDMAKIEHLVMDAMGA